MKLIKIFLGLLLGLFVIAGDRANATNNVAAPAAVTSAEDSQNYDVKRFLEEAPPLRKVVYGIDASTFLKVGESEEDAALKKGQFVHYEGAWQPDTFYNRIMDDMPGREFSNESKGAVAGFSLGGLYWDIDYSIPEGAVSTAKKTEPEVLKTHAGQRANTGEIRLRGVRTLWINSLLPGSLRWIDEDHFQGVAEGPEIGTSESDKVLTGRITDRDTDGRPTKMEYGWPALKGKGEIWKHFIYSKPVGKTRLPNIIVNEMKYLLSSGESHTFYITNMLADIDIGKATLEGAGYTPSMFLLAEGTNTPDPIVLHQANQETFVVDDSSLTPLPEENKPWEFSSYSWMEIAAVCAILIILFIWISRKTFLRKGK
ncbi:MAG: hypothetical protein M0Q48_02590 [Verrucomicrobia bacterium]|nr:hypothetical protein [Verrucomicrobiota bacterium]